MAERVPDGITPGAYSTGQRVVSILEDAGYDDIDPWWDWKTPDGYTIDFVIPASGPGVEPRTIQGSSIGVIQRGVSLLTLRMARLDADEYDHETVQAIASRTAAEANIDRLTTVDIKSPAFTGTFDIHYRLDRERSRQDPIPVTRRVAQVGDTFQDAVFEVG